MMHVCMLNSCNLHKYPPSYMHEYNIVQTAGDGSLVVNIYTYTNSQSDQVSGAKQ